MTSTNAAPERQPWAKRFNALKCCVLIPTFNNDKTLKQVIVDVSAFTHDIVVVNDGSTDQTDEILKSFDYIKVVAYSPNQGKGIALQKGLRFASEIGFEYAITIDSDGQHFASDIPAFIEKIEAEPGSLIIGARNMDQSSVPGKSNMGNKISTFWFKFETGISLPDTQSGYRLYPLSPLKNMRFFTTKYEFEIEVIVRAAWHGVPVTNVPVKVYYAPKESRVSHFRPFQDFTRVSMLNVVLVIITIFYIKPRNFFWWLKEKNFRKKLHDELFNEKESNIRKSAAVGFGIFMGIVPLWSFQMIVAISLSHLLKLNKVLVIIAANISIPPLIPLIIYLSYITGGLVMGHGSGGISFNAAWNLESIKQYGIQYIVGSIALAIISGICFGLVTFLLLKIFRKQTV